MAAALAVTSETFTRQTTIYVPADCGPVDSMVDPQRTFQPDVVRFHLGFIAGMHTSREYFSITFRPAEDPNWDYARWSSTDISIIDDLPGAVRDRVRELAASVHDGLFPERSTLQVSMTRGYRVEGASLLALDGGTRFRPRILTVNCYGSHLGPASDKILVEINGSKRSRGYRAWMGDRGAAANPDIPAWAREAAAQCLKVLDDAR